MAAQNHIAISDPALSPMNMEFVRMVDKGQNKQKKELAKLKAVLQLVEKQMAGAKSGASTKTNASSQAEGPSNTTFEQSMASMVLALQMLQVLIAKYGSDKARQHEVIAEAELNFAKSNLKKVEKAIKKMDEDKNHKLTWKDVKKLFETAGHMIKDLDSAGGKALSGHFQAALNDLKDIKKQAEKMPVLIGSKELQKIEKDLEIVGSVLMIVVGFVLEQPELVIMGALMLAVALGGAKWADKHMTKLLEDMGVPKSKAEVIAPLIVCAVAIIACTVACPAADEEVITETVEDEATTAADEVSATTDSDAEASLQSTDESSGIKSKFKKLMKPLGKVMKLLGPKGRVAIMSLMTSLSSTQAVQKYYNFFAMQEGVSKKKRKEIERDLGYAVMALTAAVTLVMAGGAAFAEEGATKGIADTLKIAKGMKALLRVGTGLNVLAESGTQIASGIITIDLGKEQKNLLDAQANIELLGVLMQMNSSETASDQKFQASEEKDQKLDDRSVTQLMKGIEGFANIAAYSSPV